METPAYLWLIQKAKPTKASPQLYFLLLSLIFYSFLIADFFFSLMTLADFPDSFSERSWATTTFQVFKCPLEWGTSWWFSWASTDLNTAGMLQFVWLLPPAKEQTVRDHIEIYITPIHVFISHIFRNAAGFLDALALRTLHPRRHTRFPSCVQNKDPIN